MIESSEKRSYGQYCGLARAAELVGERWALLIIRDLLVGARRFSDLNRGLPKIPTNILTSRLKELEAAGIVRRIVRERPLAGVAYELTERGRELEPAVIAFARWGAQALGEPRPGEIVTADSMVMALRTTFRPEAADTDASFQIELGEITLHARVSAGALEAGSGPIDDPDLVIAPGPHLRALLAGELDPAAARRDGKVALRGRLRLFPRFFEMFRI
jgi:DNA-binding HxlR family transcriptional regulator